MPPNHSTKLPNQALFTSFWSLAHWVWRTRHVAKRAAFPFSEETITETLLLELMSRHPNDIYILPLNKREEGKIGADWEWCFYDQDADTHFPMLVQAKVLDDRETEYSHIDRTIGNTGIKQIERLIDTAKRRGVAPIYAFYNHIRDTSRLPAHACACCRCVECWGCSVAPALAVKGNLPDKTFEKLSRVSVPWACLLCTDPSGEISIANQVFSNLERLYREAERTLRSEDRWIEFPKPRPPREGLPAYFSELQRIAEVRGMDRETLIDEIAEENPGLDGIVLIRR